MRAKYLEDGAIAILGTSRIEAFTRVWAGIGWPDRESGYLCVIGEKPDGRYHAFWEKTGGLWELGQNAVHAKDRFLIDCFWVDGRDILATSYLRTVDGLCFHEYPTPDKPKSLGKLFRSLRDRQSAPDAPTATVRLVPDRAIDNFRSALEKTRGVIMSGKILVHEINCPKLVYTIRQPLNDLLQSPAMKALVWVVTALEDAKGCEAQEDLPPGPWYTNLSRESM
jgi:hypothetical protein